MRIWTVQPLDVWEEIQKNGYYICDETKSEYLNDKDFDCFKKAYDWLRNEMEIKIGNPNNIKYPVWAWHTRNWKYKKPDLRESGYEKRGEKCVCLEIEIPDNEVVLTDYDLWHFVLNKWYLDGSLCEEEWDKNNEWFDSLPEEEKDKIMKESWQKIFNPTPFKNDWTSTGRYIQATFWILRLENIKKVQYFTAK